MLNNEKEFKYRLNLIKSMDTMNKIKYEKDGPSISVVITIGKESRRDRSNPIPRRWDLLCVISLRAQAGGAGHVN
jgi:hypothetical protein